MGQEITLTASDGGRFAAYLALPTRLPAPGLVVLPEVFNTNPHIRSVADGYAAAGFIALSPDVFWRQEAANYLPYTDEGRAKARALWAELDTDQFARDLGDMVGALRGRADCTGKVGVMGFCLGGALTVAAAARVAGIACAAPFYGVPPGQLADPAKIKIPLQGHFANTDDWCTPQLVNDFEKAMTAGGNKPEIYRYDAAHAFANEKSPAYNAPSAKQAWDRMMAFLAKHL